MLHRMKKASILVVEDQYIIAADIQNKLKQLGYQVAGSTDSGIEAVVDRVGLERHDLSGLAKDMGSAAVFMALLNVLVVWGLVLL